MSAIEEYIEATEEFEELIKRNLNRVIYYLNNGLVGEAMHLIYCVIDGMDDSNVTIIPDLLDLHMKHTQPVKIKKVKKINLRDIDGYQRSMVA